jgi:hypothetical protein
MITGLRFFQMLTATYIYTYHCLAPSDMLERVIPSPIYQLSQLRLFRKQ